MIDTFNNPKAVVVDVQDPLIDVFDGPPVVTLSIDPDRAPGPRAPVQRARLPVPVIQVTPTLLITWGTP